MRDMQEDNGQLGGINVLLALVAGALTAAAVLTLGVPGLDPSMWNETAVVAGLRPPKVIFPGIWRVLVGWMFPLLGTSAAIAVLKVVGALVAGLCAALMCLVTRIVLSLLIRTAQPFAVWSNRIAPFFAFCAALLFGMSEPLWRISRVFSPDQLRFLLFIGIVFLLLRWFTVGGRWRLFPTMFLVGVMAAETPFAYLLPIMVVGSYIVVWHCVQDGLFPKPETLEEPSMLPKWRMLFLFLGGIAATAWLNTEYFAALGGIAANAWNSGHVYFHYAASYWHVLMDAASPVAWVLGIGFCVVPLVVAIHIFPSSARDDRPMPFATGALFFFIGALAMTQTGVLQATRFWLFARDTVQVQSGFLLLFFVFCAILTVALFGAAFAFECQRTYLSEEDGIPPPGILLRGLAPLFAVIYVAAGAMQIRKPAEKEMQRIVDDAINEIVTECEDSKWLFTDGLLDPAVEIEAARRGGKLYALNMMSGASAWESAICRRGFEPGSQDMKTVETGVPILLRVWAGEKPDGMNDAALQLGFEFWKRDRRKLPKASGMVARVKWNDEELVVNGIKNAEAISKRIIALSPELDNCDPSPELAKAFSAVSWRLSRFARMRKDLSLARELDLSNRALKRMLSALEYERMRTFMQLTPKESLQIALKRANFQDASRYAPAVLQYDDSDPEANFGLGMAALLGNRMKDAEFYLLRVLKRRPDEPAVLNNLSICYRKQRKYKEAIEFAERAIKLLPDSPEVKETLQDARNHAP